VPSGVRQSRELAAVKRRDHRRVGFVEPPGAARVAAERNAPDERAVRCVEERNGL